MSSSVINNNNRMRPVVLFIVVVALVLLSLLQSSSSFVNANTLVACVNYEFENPPYTVIIDGNDPSSTWPSRFPDGLIIGGSVQGCFITIRNVFTKFIEFVDKFERGHILVDNVTFDYNVHALGNQIRFLDHLINIDYLVIRKIHTSIGTGAQAAIHFYENAAIRNVGYVLIHDNNFKVESTRQEFFFVRHEGNIENIHQNISYYNNVITKQQISQSTAVSVSAFLYRFVSVTSTPLVDIRNNQYVVNASSLSDMHLAFMYVDEFEILTPANRVQWNNISTLVLADNLASGTASAVSSVFFTMFYVEANVAVSREMLIDNNNVDGLRLAAPTVDVDMLLSFGRDVRGEEAGEGTVSPSSTQSLFIRNNRLNVTVENTYRRSLISYMRMQGLRNFHAVSFSDNWMVLESIAMPTNASMVDQWTDSKVHTSLDYIALDGVVDLISPSQGTLSVTNNYLRNTLECYTCNSTGHFFTVKGENITNTSSIVLSDNIIISSTRARVRLVETDISTFHFNANISDVGSFSLNRNDARWYLEADSNESSTTSSSSSTNSSSSLTTVSKLSCAHLFFEGPVQSLTSELVLQNEYFRIQTSAGQRLVDPVARFLSFGSTVEKVRKIEFSNATFWGSFQGVNGTADLSVLTFVDSVYRIARNRYMQLAVSGVNFNVDLETCYDFTPQLVGFGFFGTNTSEFQTLKLENSNVRYHEKLASSCVDSSSSSSRNTVHRHDQQDKKSVAMTFFSATDKVGLREPLEMINNTLQLRLIEEQSGYSSFTTNFTFAAFSDLLKYSTSGNTSLVFSGNSLLVEENDQFPKDNATHTLRFPNGPLAMNLILFSQFATSVSSNNKENSPQIHLDVENNLLHSSLYLRTPENIMMSLFSLFSTSSENENLVLTLFGNILELVGFEVGGSSFSSSSSPTSEIAFLNFTAPQLDSSSISLEENFFIILDNDTQSSQSNPLQTIVMNSPKTSIDFFSINTRIESPSHPLVISKNHLNIARLEMKGESGTSSSSSSSATPNRTFSLQFLRFHQYLDVGTFDQGLYITENEMSAIVYESLSSYTTDSVASVSFVNFEGIEISSIYGASLVVTGNTAMIKTEAAVIPYLEFFRSADVVNNIFLFNASSNHWAVSANRKPRNFENSTDIYSTSVSSKMFSLANLKSVTYLLFERNTLSLGNDACGGSLSFSLLDNGNGNESYSDVWQWSIAENTVRLQETSSSSWSLPGCDHSILPTQHLALTLSHFHSHPLRNITFFDLHKNSYNVEGIDRMTESIVFQFDEMIHNISNFSITENTGVFGTTTRNTRALLLDFKKTVSHVGFEQYDLRSNPSIDQCFTTTTLAPPTTTSTTTVPPPTTNVSTTEPSSGNATEGNSTTEFTTTVETSTTASPTTTTDANATTQAPCTNLPLPILDKTFGFSFTISKNKWSPYATVDLGSSSSGLLSSTDGRVELHLALFEESVTDISNFDLEHNTINYGVMTRNKPDRVSFSSAMIVVSKNTSQIDNINIKHSKMEILAQGNSVSSSSEKFSQRDFSSKMIDFSGGVHDIGNFSVSENDFQSQSMFFTNSTCVGSDLGVDHDWQKSQKIEILDNIFVCQSREVYDVNSTADFMKLQVRSSSSSSSSSLQLPNHILFKGNNFTTTTKLDTLVSNSSSSSSTDGTNMISRFLNVYGNDEQQSTSTETTRSVTNIELFLVEDNYVNFDLTPQLMTGSVTAQFVSWELSTIGPKADPITTTSTTTTTTEPPTTETNSTTTSSSTFTSTSSSTSTATSTTDSPLPPETTNTEIVNCSAGNSSDPNATLGNVTCIVTPTPAPPTTSSTTSSTTTSSTTSTTSSTTTTTSSSTTTSTTSSTTTSTTTTTTTMPTTMTTMPPSAAARPEPHGLTVRNCEIHFTLSQSSHFAGAAALVAENATSQDFASPLHSKQVSFHVGSFGSHVHFNGTSLQFYDMKANFTFSSTRFSEFNDRVVAIGETTSVDAAFLFVGTSSVFSTGGTDAHFILQDNMFGLKSDDENIYSLHSHFLDMGSSIDNITELALDNLTYEVYVSGVELASPGTQNSNNNAWYFSPSDLVELNISLASFRSLLENVDEFQVTHNNLVIRAARGVEEMNFLGVSILEDLRNCKSLIVSRNNVNLRHDQGISGNYINSITSRGLKGDFSFLNITSGVWAPVLPSSSSTSSPPTSTTSMTSTTTTSTTTSTTTLPPPPTTSSSDNESTSASSEAPSSTSEEPSSAPSSTPSPPPAETPNRYVVENNRIEYILVTFQQFEKIWWQSNWFELGHSIHNMNSISVQYNKLFTDLLCVDRPGLPPSDVPTEPNITATPSTTIITSSTNTINPGNETTISTETSTTEVPSTTTATSTTTSSTTTEIAPEGPTNFTITPKPTTPADTIPTSFRCIITGTDEGNRTFISIGRMISCETLQFQSNSWEYSQHQISNLSASAQQIMHHHQDHNALAFYNFHGKGGSSATDLSIGGTSFEVVSSSYGGSVLSLAEETNVTFSGQVSITGTKGIITQPENKTEIWKIIPQRTVDYSMFHFFDGSILGFTEMGLSDNEWNCSTVGEHPPSNFTCGMFLMKSAAYYSPLAAPTTGGRPVKINGLIRAENNIVFGETQNTFPSWFRANNGSFGQDFSIRLRNNDLRNYYSDNYDPFANNTQDQLPNIIPRYLDVDNSTWYWSCNYWGDIAQNRARGRVCGTAHVCNNFPCSITLTRASLSLSESITHEPTLTNESTPTHEPTMTANVTASESNYTRLPDDDQKSKSFTEEHTVTASLEATPTTHTMELTETMTNVTPRTPTLTTHSRTGSDVTATESPSEEETLTENVTESTSLSSSLNITQTHNTPSESHTVSHSDEETLSHPVTVTNWTFSVSKSKNTHTISQTEVIVVIHPPDVLQPTITAMVTGTSLVAGLISVFGAGASVPFIAAAARTQAVINLLSGVISEECGGKENYLERAFAESPLNLDIGGEPSGIYVGTLVGNLALTFGLLLVAFFIGGAFRSSRSVKGTRSACPSLLEAASTCYLNFILCFCTLVFLIVTITSGGVLSTRSEMPPLWRGFGPFIDVIIIALVCVWLYYSLFKTKLVIQFSWFEDTGLAPGFAKIHGTKKNQNNKNKNKNKDFDDDDTDDDDNSQDSDDKKKMSAESRRILEMSDDDDDVPPPPPPHVIIDQGNSLNETMNREKTASSPGLEMKEMNHHSPREGLDAPLIVSSTESNNNNKVNNEDEENDEEDEEEEEEEESQEALDERDKAYQKLQADKKKRLEQTKNVSYYDRISFFIAYWFDPFGEWFIPTHHKKNREEQLRFKALTPLVQPYTDRSPRFFCLEVMIQILLGLAVIIADGANRSCGAHSTLFALIFSAYLVLVVAKKPFRHRVSHVAAVISSLFHLFAIIVCLLMSASSPSDWLRDLAFVLAALQVILFILAVFLFLKEVVWPYIPGLIAYIRGKREQYERDQKKKKEEEERKRRERNRKTELGNSGKNADKAKNLQDLHAKEDDEDTTSTRKANQILANGGGGGEQTLEHFSNTLDGMGERGNTPVLGRSTTNNLYAGVDTPASAFPQPVVTNRSEEQQKQYEDMFTKLDQNLRKEFATLADTERLAMQSPREKNNKKGSSPSFAADSIKNKKDRQAERIAKLNETEEEMQKEIEEKKKQEELTQPGLPDDNNNDNDDDDDDDTNHEIAKQHQTAEKSYKNLAQAFDEFVGL